jgi:signal transduction histidine kinase
LRTPLNAIIGFASMLRDTQTYELDAEKHQGYADYILQSADLLLDHINTLLESAALDSGEMTLESGAIDFRELLVAAVERAKIAARSAQISIEIKSSDQPVIGWGDEQRLSQALDHLLRAAVRLSPTGEKILVRAVVDEKGWAEIAIRDRTPGMTPEAVSHALNAFRDVNRGLDRSFEGPGVGLAIAKTFVEMQGGRFNLKSRPNEGTLVRISAPPPAAKSQASDASIDTNTKEVRLAG